MVQVAKITVYRTARDNVRVLAQSMVCKEEERVSMALCTFCCASSDALRSSSLRSALVPDDIR